MRKFMAAAAIVCCLSVASAGESTQEALEKAIAALNKAFTTGDAETLQRLMTPDHIAVTPYYGAPKTRDEQIKSLPEHKLTEYAAGQMKITTLNKNVALITYALTMKGTFGGQALPARSFASAIWVNREGAWREVFYQETALKD